MAGNIKYPGDKTYIFRFSLNDKTPTDYSLDKPWQFLSKKSIERRRRQGIAIDSTDLPVCSKYIMEIESHDVDIIGTSRWQNTVLVRSSDSLLLEQLARLHFVKHHKCVFISPDSIEAPEDIRWKTQRNFNRWDSVKNDTYGMARPQIEMLGGIKLHDAGYRGKGMTIAVLDGGFQNYNRIQAFKNTNIAGKRDFVATRPQLAVNGKVIDPFQYKDHGTKVLSAMAAIVPEVTMGTAPEATYWLMRCEDQVTEQPVEEDYWTMAAEAADSAGVDIISSSLCYYNFDGNRGDYSLQDLDGQTAFISRTASMLAGKGIILCNSAGNSGMGQWKKIGVPADATNIITVGAVDKVGRLASFSSIGPAQDGRVKPDVVAQGAPTALISGRNTLVHDMGTSFSTPLISGLVACLWQALPDKTALQIIEMVKSSAHQHDAPTNIYGYGIPDFWKAYTEGNNNQK